MQDGRRETADRGGEEHRCGAKPEKKRAAVTPLVGLRASSRGAVDLMREAARSLASWRHLMGSEGESTGHVEASGHKVPRQNPEPVAAPDPSVAGTSSIMNIFQKVSDIEVRVDYIDSAILDPIKLHNWRSTNEDESTSGDDLRRNP
ncbi:uncharacterized protein [Dermacentor andersoni]|uniref:uncharacterized protein n=1 Tax=Dermacentor andersoni TaxID=34620 RepID=UPI003B3AF022